MGFNTSLYKWDSVNPAQFVGLDELCQFAQIERFYPFVYQFVEIRLHHRADRDHGGVFIGLICQQLERLLVGDFPQRLFCADHDAVVPGSLDLALDLCSGSRACSTWLLGWFGFEFDQFPERSAQS